MKFNSLLKKIVTQTLRAAVAVFDTLFFRRNLKYQISQLEIKLSLLQRATRDAAELYKAQLQTLSQDEESARAQLCRLRVQQETILDRTGFMVSAFIPEGVLKQLQSGTQVERDKFKHRVLKPLVDYAMQGLFRVNKLGNLTALIFEPLGVASNKRIVTPIFESTKDGKPVFQAVVSPDLQLIQREQKKLLTDAIESVE